VSDQRPCPDIKKEKENVLEKGMKQHNRNKKSEYNKLSPQLRMKWLCRAREQAELMMSHYRIDSVPQDSIAEAVPGKDGE
jgi:hypothetical protein